MKLDSKSKNTYAKRRDGFYYVYSFDDFYIIREDQLSDYQKRLIEEYLNEN